MNDLFQKIRKQETDLQNGKSLDIISFLNKKKTEVIEGYEDGYKVLAMIKLLETEIEAIKKELQPIAVNELSEPILWQGFKFEQTASGRYDYSHSLEWNELNEQRKKLEKDMQIVWKTGNAMFDNQTGLEIQPAVYKPNTVSIKITKTK